MHDIAFSKQLGQLVTFGVINQVDHFLPFFEPLGVLDQDIRSDVKLAFGIAGQVGRHDTFRMSPQRVSIRKRFWVCDVDCGAKETFGRIERGKDIF